jgi:predicted esterase
VPSEKCASTNLHRRLTESALADIGESAQDGDADVGFLRGLDLLHRMSLNDMSYLVSERAGQLIEPLGALDEPAVHVDVTAGERERVHLVGVDDIEMPVEIRPARGARDLRSQLLDVRTYQRIGDDRKRRIDLVGILAAEGNLLIFGDAAREQDGKNGQADTDHGTVVGKTCSRRARYTLCEWWGSFLSLRLWITDKVLNPKFHVRHSCLSVGPPEMHTCPMPPPSFKHQHITVPKTARYAVLGSFDADLKEVWIVCHGYGQLAARFLSRFVPLDRNDRLFIAPEALSRFYLTNTPNGVHRPDSPIGASWMTREDREAEIEDQVTYLDLVYDEIFRRVRRDGVRLWVLGFSQGVSTVIRWLARGHAVADRVVLWAGMIPPELETGPARSLCARAPVTLVVGSTDEFATPKVVAAQEAKLRELGVAFNSITFEGGHDLSDSTLLEIAADDA